jgi:hypothetical protein
MGAVDLADALEWFRGLGVAADDVPFERRSGRRGCLGICLLAIP